MARVFAERLKQAIQERGWSQNEAGRYLGVSGKQVSRYLAGAQPTLPVAARLAERLGVTLDELAGLQRPAQQPPREVVLLIDGAPWIAHAERRTESRARLEQALEDARAFEASRGQLAPRRDRRRRTR